MPRLAFLAPLVLAAAALAACASLPPQAAGALPADALLLGEQHDAPSHSRLHHETVAGLARRNRLPALALEMAEHGAGTTGLPADADEAAVREALQWNEQAWPWSSYGPAVMAAVRAGVPVLGANLPRDRMRASMADESLDTLLPAQALARQREAVAQGHCGLLPQARIAPMTRIQVARDQAMAQAVAQAAQPGKTVVLLAGSAHVDPELGVPLHLPPALRAVPVLWPAEATGQDYCAQLRQQLGR